MTPKQVNKLYAELTPEEQASLAFDAASRLDESEYDAILANIPKKTYTMPHFGFHHQTMKLSFLVMQYGIEYWRLRALMLYGMLYEDLGLDEMIELYIRRLVAVETALETVCHKFKINPNTIRKMAHCPNINDTRNYIGDPELVAFYTDYFMPLKSL